jgi:branched-subunit amino acid ABC-type transport system permease component
MGRVLRATADNMSLAEVRGINVNRVIVGVWFLAGAFAALGGVLLGYETFVRPTLGLSILLPMFAAATVGGLGSLPGAVVGAYLLAFAQNLILGIDFGWGADWYVNPGYKSALALGLLVLVLLVRPGGLFRGDRA